VHFRNLDLNLLVALDTLLRERNITLAGKRLHLTQSAMSGALSRLREYFGDELLVQVGRRMVPTPLGESLAEPVRNTLLNIQATIATKTVFDPASSKRHFKLMMSDYAATVLMSLALPRIETLAPRIRVDVLSNDVDSPSEELERGSVDFLIMPERYLLKGHPNERLFEDEFVCVAWNANPRIPAGTTALSLEAYLGLGHVVVQFGTARGVMFDEWVVEGLGLERRVEVVVMNFTSVFPSVVGSQRIATVHRRHAQFYAQYLPIRLLEVPLQTPRLAEAAQWHRHFDADTAVLWMRGVLHEAARDMEARFQERPSSHTLSAGRPSSRSMSANPPKRFFRS
jgi:LysR family transcriptional regulator, nod-box dependent transcriptional activator